MTNNKNDDPKIVSTVPQEMPAVRTTIVGGRPPGSGKNIGQIPRGIEVLVKKAVVDSHFRSLLLAKRSAAADTIGLKLDATEAAMLDIVPAAQLEAIISQTRVEPTIRPAFLGKAAAVMLVALGAGSYVANGQVLVGDRVDRPKPPVATMPAGNVNQPIAPAGVRPTVLGIQPPAPATQPTSQPTSIPALSAIDAAKIDALIKRLDAEQYTDREAAQKELLDIGIAAIPTLQGKAADQSLSLEVRARLDTIVGKLKATTRPVRSLKPREVMIQEGMRMAVPGETTDED